ncbi:MAG TPA: SPOR domain-containing protein [Thermodesulfobacteriota bacterium]|nr:SPOR domain-containing protein [Thermodesulfobacteriota bacterium]
MSRNNSSGKSRILAFFVAFVILFMVVFGVGVFVGKGLNKESFQTTRSFNEQPPAPPAAPFDDETAEAPEQPAESPGEPLPESFPVEDEGDTPTEDAVMAKADPAPPPPVPTPKPVPTPAPKTPAPKTPAPRTPAPPPPAPTRDARAEKLAEIARSVAEEKRAEEAAEATNAPKPQMPKVDPSGDYTVQIGSFQDQKQANSLAGSLKAKGYPAFVKPMATPNNKYWYRVRVGTFRNVEDAKAYGDSLKKAESEVEIVFITVNN